MYSPARKQELQALFEKSLGNHPPKQKQSASLSPGLEESFFGTASSDPRAAVALLVKHNAQGGDLEFLLTLRSALLKLHPSEVCLPGGQADEEDEFDLLKTLDREIEEEMGISKNSVEWISQPWDNLKSRSGIEVFPYLGFLESSSESERLAFNWEVERAEWIPLAKLFDERLWGQRKLARALSGRPVQTLPFWEGFSPLVWGLTAGFLWFFRERISGRAPY